MMLLFIGIACALLSLVAAALLRTFQSISLTELKRRARKGDELSKLLYRAGAYGPKTKLIAGVTAVLFGYVALLLFEASLGTVRTAAIVVVAVLFGAWFISSKSGASKPAVWLTSKLSPSLAWCIERLHPVVELTHTMARKIYPLNVHGGIYDREDIVHLLEELKKAPHGSVKPGEIDLAVHAMSFGDLSVAEALVPKRVVVSVGETESIGPVLMDRLHKSGHSRFPVFSGNQNNITGVLYLREVMGVTSGGSVRDIMRRQVTYVHEDYTLYQTLQAFLKTKQHLFVVVNSYEEYVGIITIEDVLEKMIGKQIMEEFDEYEDLRAVAASVAKKDHTNHERSHTEVTPDATEVV